jgi:hypothetical protein
VRPPPANVGDAAEQLIVDVPALKVIPVEFKLTAVAPDNVTVEEPKEILLVPVLPLSTNCPVVML